MPNMKISELPLITESELQSNDVLPIVDTNAETTKKISIADLDQRYNPGVITRGNLTGVNISVTGGSQAVLGNGVIISMPQPLGTGATVQFLKLITSMIDVDNIRLDGNDISTIGINADLNLNPNGSGKINLLKQTFIESLLKINSVLELDKITSNISGENQVLGNPSKTIVQLINSDLESIQGINSSVPAGRIFILTNKTGVDVLVKNNTGTPGSRIITGSGNDLDFKNNSSLWIYKDDEFYVVGGSGSGGGAVSSVNGQVGDVLLNISDLEDVEIDTILDGQVLRWDSVDGVWKNSSLPAAPVDSVNGQVGEVILDLDDLDDVEINTPTDGDILNYNDGAWENSNRLTEAESDISALESGKIDKSVLTTKGDLLSRDASNLVRLPVGSDGQILEALSSEASGMRWVNKTPVSFPLKLEANDYFPSPMLDSSNPIEKWIFSDESEKLVGKFIVPYGQVLTNNIALGFLKAFVNSNDDTKNVNLVVHVKLFKNGTVADYLNPDAQIITASSDAIPDVNNEIFGMAVTIAPGGIIDDTQVSSGDILFFEIYFDRSNNSPYLGEINLIKDTATLFFSGV